MASTTGIIYHDRFLDHDTGPGHPERAERLRSLVSHLKESGIWQQLQHPIIDHAAEEWILKVHTPQHLRYVRDACRRGAQILDSGDTHASVKSYDVAMLAASGVLCAVDAVASGILKNVFCAVRPPGHHAERNEVMGFCLFNNIAIATRYAQIHHHVGKIAIVDWDVHHGNGTQRTFYEDPSVLFISLHQYPFYPGTGSRLDRGEGAGEGFTLNFPMRSGSSEKEYLDTFTQEIIPAIDTFKPEMMMISAGFDAHQDDPLAKINLTEESFAKMTSLVKEVAGKHCGGKIVSVLEGGYNLRALARSVESHLQVLMS